MVVGENSMQAIILLLLWFYSWCGNFIPVKIKQQFFKVKYLPSSLQN